MVAVVIAIRINTGDARREAGLEGLLAEIFGVQGQRCEQQESAKRALPFHREIVFSGSTATSGTAMLVACGI
jgi:hypothetical protein